MANNSPGAMVPGRFTVWSQELRSNNPLGWRLEVQKRIIMI